MLLVQKQICLCRNEVKIMQGKLNYPICNAMMDTYHEPHGTGTGFESRAGLSFPLVRLSSLGGISDDDPFFRHTFLGVVLIRPLSFLILEISLDPSSRISVVVKLDLLRLLLNP